MPFFKLPEPGTNLGPCVPTCEHIDCAANREQAETLCRICGTPIGYETTFVYEQMKPLVMSHYDCYQKAWETGEI